MKFSIPQFIERESPVVGPLTFRQFIYFAIAGVICFFLYFRVSFFVFTLASIILGGIAAIFAFGQIGGKPLIVYLGNLLKFTFSPKIYLWKRKEEPVFLVFKRSENKKKKTKSTEDELPLKLAENSQLKKLKTKIETKV